MTGAGTDPAKFQAALVVLESMGLTVGDLTSPADTKQARPVPTFREWVPVVADAVSDRTRTTYQHYWDLIVAEWGERRMDEVTPTEMTTKREQVRRTALVRRTTRGGTAAAENFVAALRCLYKYLVADTPMSENPALKVAKPRRPPSKRHALSNTQLAELNAAAVTTGDDPALDGLLLRTHTETASRRGAALRLRRQDLDVRQCLVLLREKGGIDFWAPVSPTLMRHLVEHFDSRCGGSPEDQLLRYRDGRPLTTRRYDGLWLRLGEHLSWVRSMNVATHWLRHTTLTWVERNFGYGVAKAYAGHFSNNDNTSTSSYIRANLVEVATALSELTGEKHPLVP
ncbi:site-specific recombinase XerD [Crossiella equi]|uniref:Site-specific recombinase XerD n=1 Tax=Crossiella equi TaxID=130796 RepID=A0ABS5A3N1_9PSEU|nr:tyrosine-type recombinase/integrase [Crossiella equi]MBP2471185.1 site-specific recombinase XerD [Crossiella equi]